MELIIGVIAVAALVITQTLVLKAVRGLQSPPIAQNSLVDSLITRVADVEAQVRGFKTSVSELQNSMELKHQSVTQMIYRDRKGGKRDPSEAIEALMRSGAAIPIEDEQPELQLPAGAVPPNARVTRQPRVVRG